MSEAVRAPTPPHKDTFRMPFAPLRTLVVLALASALASTAACGDEATNTGTESVTLSFGIQSLNGDSVAEERDLTPETFLEEAHASLGRDFTGLALTKVVLRASGATGLNGWSDLFKGDLRVYLETESGDSFLAASTTAPAGFGALSLPVAVTQEQLSSSSDALRGKLTVRILAKSGRNQGDFFSVNVEAQLTFAAY